MMVLINDRQNYIWMLSCEDNTCVFLHTCLTSFISNELNIFRTPSKGKDAKEIIGRKMSNERFIHFQYKCISKFLNQAPFQRHISFLYSQNSWINGVEHVQIRFVNIITRNVEVAAILI